MALEVGGGMHVSGRVDLLLGGDKGRGGERLRVGYYARESGRRAPGVHGAGPDGEEDELRLAATAGLVERDARRDSRLRVVAVAARHFEEREPGARRRR